MFNITEYILGTRTTAIYPGAMERGEPELSYLTLGLAGEVCGEFLDYLVYECREEAIKELGDSSYYSARLLDWAGVTCGNFIEFSTTGEAIAEMQKAVGALCNVTKKVKRDNADISVGSHTHEVVIKSATIVLSGIKYFSKRFGSDFETVLSLNADKLASRKERGVLQGNGDNR